MPQQVKLINTMNIRTYKETWQSKTNYEKMEQNFQGSELVFLGKV